MTPGGEFHDRESGGTEACPSDGELVALLDDALGEPRMRVVRRHLASCRSCRSRMARLRERDEAVRSWLRRHDPPPPPPQAYHLTGGRSAPGFRSDSGRNARRERNNRRWAAAAVLVLVAGVLAGPARGWVADRFEAIVDAGPPAAESVGAGPDVSPATSFAPSGRVLDVVFAGRPAAGALVIDRGRDALVTVRVPTGVELRVQSDRVLVAGSAPSAGEYRLTVPSDLDRVVVRVPGADPVDVDVREGAPLPRRILLERPDPRPAGR